jgi:phosphoribosylamine---glycine ligase
LKILVVGGGAREHALAWQFRHHGHSLLAAPGNPGLAQIAECLPIGVEEVDELVAAAAKRQVDLVVVGPEGPLVLGLCDQLRSRGIAAFGPGADGARLEGSKSYCKGFFARHGIRSAAYRTCQTMAQAEQAVAEMGDQVVVKADGLAAGKGVVVCDRAEQAVAAARDMLEGGQFGAAGRTVVIEQRLTGRELSVMAITDGTRYEVLEQAEDHKAVFDGDRGPNTGGMGTASPAGWATSALIERIRREIFDRTVAGLRADGVDFRGVLYAGIMVAEDGTPWMLEYNCRFGDPETEPVMARLKSDLASWLAGAARGALPAAPLEWDERTAVCVILAAEGYPGTPQRGDVIEGVEQFDDRDDVVVFHAGTRTQGADLVTAGGRVLAVTALADGIEAARSRAYSAVDCISFRGMHFRRDIGARGA